ncbi:MAG: hypothetical protein H0W30_19050 [Gemmatimonadaceae bacterium]|nr:hypothetical protein [Gemmatimonadaceae bacterium]
MKREDDQELWDLLGKAPQPAPSPFFSRNVVRKVREQGDWRDIIARWFTSGKLIPATAVALAVGFAAMWIEPHGGAPETDNLPAVVTVIDPQDYDVVFDLDNLLAAEDDNVWNDDVEALSL